MLQILTAEQQFVVKNEPPTVEATAQTCVFKCVSPTLLCLCLNKCVSNIWVAGCACVCVFCLFVSEYVCLCVCCNLEVNYWSAAYIILSTNICVLHYIGCSALHWMPRKTYI